MLNFRFLVAIQILLAVLLGFPLYGWLDFSGQSLQPKFSQVKPEEAMAMARLLAGSYASLALAALGFLLPGPWTYRQKAAAGFCFANLVAAALVLRRQGTFSDEWFVYGLLFAHFLLAVGFCLNALDPDTTESELPGARWFSFRNVLTFLVAGVAALSAFTAVGGVGSFTRYPGRISAILGGTFALLAMVLILLILLSFVARSLFTWEAADGEEQVRKRLLKQLGQTAVQEERNRLARDLHDSIKQQIFSIHLSVATARERWERDPPGARQRLDDIARSAKEALVEMQALLQQLSPHAVASVGLIEALREQCEALGYRAGAQVDFEIGEPLPENRLPAQTQESLFRIAQEALSNVARHARAEHVRMALGRRGDAVVLEIEDDGRGFEPGQEARGLGLRNMEERTAELGGSCQLRSRPGAGTALTITIPLLEDAANANRQALSDARNTHQFFMGFSILLGLHAFLIAPNWKIPSLIVAIVHLGLLACIFWIARRVTHRARKQLANQAEPQQLLAALEHRSHAWFAMNAMIQSLKLGWPQEAWTPGSALCISMASLLALWTAWELFRFHRLKRFEKWRELTRLQRISLVPLAAGVIFPLLSIAWGGIAGKDLAALALFGTLMYTQLGLPWPPRGTKIFGVS